MSGRTGPSGKSPLEKRLIQLEIDIDTTIEDKLRELDKKNIKLVKDFLDIRNILKNMQEDIYKIETSIYKN
jgi:mRNA-degrading endonuclease RelE of RelBE toxin-antitoxin system